MRKKIYEVISVGDRSGSASDLYDWAMMFVICLSMIPLMFKGRSPVLSAIDTVAAVVFIVDYCFRLFTADLQLNRGPASFFLYPFTPMAIIDLVCILPSFTVLAGGFRLLKILRLFRTFRVFRAFKMVRYSKSIQIITAVIKTQKEPLFAVCVLAGAYIFISALVVFNVEPDTFGSFFDAVYWASVSLTTVGYGDIYPTTMAGRAVAMASSFAGIAIVALPSGIITAGYMDELKKDAEKREGNGTQV